MAEHAVNSVTSAVTNELTSRVFSGLVQRYGKDAATSKKLQRLEMLLIKVNSAIEASEKITIENSWLLRWRDKLKEAASRGDEVLASFPQCTNNANGEQQQGEAASSTSAAAPSTDVGPLSFTKSSLSGMVQGIRNAKNILFSSVGDDMVRLNTTLGSLEQLSPDLDEFIRLLYLEALPKVVHTPHSASLSTKLHGPRNKVMKATKKNHFSFHASKPSTEPRLFSLSRPKEEQLELQPPPPHFCYDISSCEPAHLYYSTWDLAAVVPKDVLQGRLEVAFVEICTVINVADSHDLEDLEWLTYWVGILREAMEQGHHVLGTTSACRTINTEDSKELECDQEEDELNTFVHRLEGLVRDVEYFIKLVYLCPTR